MSQTRTWRKASFSVNNTGCVEVADTGEEILVRDSKNPSAGHLAFTRHELDCFVKGVKAGEFDDLL